jgi:hypothetical protein
MPAPEWARIANTTIHDFIRQEEINILRNRKLLAMLKDRGRITMNHEGDFMDWKVRYKRAPMQGYADSDTLTFSRRNRWQTAQLDWRGYAATDSITKLEKLKNKGTAAIIKVASTLMESLMDDMDENFGDELYIDGNASGNQNRIHGLESFFSVSGANAAAPIGTNNDTYAGLTTAVNDYGGSWSGSWPTGTGSAEYDFWTPLVVDYESAVATASGGWAASTKTWPNTCREALRFGIIKAKKNKSKKGMMDLILLNDDLYRVFLDKLDANERTTVKRGDGKGGLYALGFTDVVNFDGVDVTSEYGVPATVGYGLNMASMELRSLQGQMFVPDDIDFDIASQSDRYAITFFGNMRCNPRPQVKWDDVT